MIPILLTLIFSILFPVNNAMQSNQPPSFSARLIHRSSPENPFYNPDYSWADFLKDAATDSIARSHQFGSISNQSKYEYAPLKGWEFIMQYQMGTPAVDVYGVLDTGSSLTWFQCLPCIHCYNFRDSNYTLFDPSKSSSYRHLACGDSRCGFMSPLTKCSSLGDCRYSYVYYDEANTTGFLSLDSMTVQSKNVDDDGNVREAKVTINQVIFGCGDDNYDQAGLPGIFGIGNSSYSFIRQQNYSHFSYYTYANDSHNGGEVHFGKETEVWEINFTTPIIPNQNTGFYYLELEGIRIDDYPIYIPPGTFDMSEDGERGFVIDSGTTITTLPSFVFDRVKKSIIEIMQARFMSDPESYENWELCYWDANGAPQVEFEFTGFIHRLCAANQWLKMPTGIYCLAIQRTSSSISILGMHQQMYVNVGYDLNKNLLTMSYPRSCPDDPVVLFKQ